MRARANKKARLTEAKTSSETSDGVEVDSPQKLWDEHISQRKPKLFQSLPNTRDWNTDAWLESFPKHLKKQAGKCTVEVEFRDADTTDFGRGQKTSMSFGAFLDRISKGDTSLYLTTQEPEWDEEHGVPRVISQLLERLQHDFPVMPEVLGNLVPHQVNLWIGAAPEGSSSGLHHDYHDNLYCLLRGRKRFRLFPPAMASQLYTHGTIHEIHPSGRIVYKGQEGTRADGATEEQIRRFEARQSAEAELRAAEADCARQRAQGGAPSPQALARQDAAEQALDAALGEDLDGFAQDDALEDPDDRDEKALEDSGDEEDADHTETDSEIQQKADPSARDRKGVPKERLREPDSFSRVRDLGRDDEELRRKFPDLPGKAAATEVVVNEGQMLYLPAGWFHEVTSYGKQHMALSYWMHPPDNLAAGSNGFKRPYTSDFWPQTWSALRAG